ncbi:MAG: SpoIIE family protein phosphatase [Solobacterium sp.]|nr:SpoIIE family protein phosphatase [Solobacterium sp.]
MRFLKQHLAYKSIAGIVFLLAVFSIVVGQIGYRIFTEGLLSQYADGAFRTCRAADSVVNSDRMDAYAASGGVTEEYQTVYNHLERLCNSTKATFIYVIRPDVTDYKHVTFLFSTMNHNSHYTLFDFGYVRETTNQDYARKYQALYEGTSDQELVVRDQGYIETDPHITAMTPLKDSSGKVQGILCVQRQMDVLIQTRNSYLNRVMFAFVIMVLLVIAGQGVFLHFVLLKPLNIITEEAGRFASENVIAPKKLTETIRNQDEIGRLAGSIDQMEEQVRDYIINLTRVTSKNERISTELALATRIQGDMLPNVFPAFPERFEFDIFASMNPAREVGGDFYDFFLIDEDHLCLMIADVSGKGIPAALFMMAARIILANNAMLGKTPAEILADTNTAILSNNREEMFVTVWLGILEVSTGKLTAANAGHEYPIIKNGKGEFELIKDKHSFVIGGLENVRYHDYELQLEPGSAVFLYTDGVTEAETDDHTLFGTDRLLEALNSCPEQKPEKILKHVRETVSEFVKNAEQIDDLTMLCVEYRGTENV